MREFFRGWKRKVGAVTLGVACAIMIVWAQSLDAIQTAEFTLRNTQVRMKSFQGELYCFAWEESWKEHNRSTRWSNRRVLKAMEAGKLRSQLRAQLDEARRLTGGWVIPYWSIVIPAILLSAYLLLSKPRATAPLKTGQLKPAERV